MYRDIPQDLREVIEPIVQDHQLELVDATLSGAGRGRAQLTVVIDTAAGDGRVTVDACAGVSREVSHALDAADVVAGGYVLEVCSPGIDRALAREIDFERAVGLQVALETREPLEGRRRFKGELVAFASSELELRTESGDLRIPFDRVAKAKSFYPEATLGQTPLAQRSSADGTRG